LSLNSSLLVHIEAQVVKGVLILFACCWCRSCQFSPLGIFKSEEGTNVQVDRVYVGSPGVIAVLDHEKKRTFIVRKEGLPDIGKMHDDMLLLQRQTKSSRNF